MLALECPITGVPQLCHYELNQLPKGICLIINNASNLNLAEEVQLSDLFCSLAFDVQIRQNLTMIEINRVAQELAAKDHSNYGVFVFFVISLGSHDHEISGVDGRKASVEQVMSEFSSRNCPSLQNKPKLFFVQRFTMSPSNKPEESQTAHCFYPTATMEESHYFLPKIRLEGMFAPKKPIFCWLAHALKLMKHSKFRSRPSYRLEITLIWTLLKVIKISSREWVF